MEFIEEKLMKQENGLTKLLRKLLKQKDDAIKNTKIENFELKELVLRQQEMINKLNSENMVLVKTISESKENQLIECNKSLKQQLLVSQNQNSILLHDLEKAQAQVKYLNKKLSKF